MINFGKSGGSGSGWKIGASTSLVRTDWIPTNIGQWQNRSLVRIEF